MAAARSRRWSLWLAAALAIGVGSVGLWQLSHAVSSTRTDTPPPLIACLADDCAAPLLRLLGTRDPSPAAVAATIRYALWALVALGLLLAATAARTHAAFPAPRDHR
ncbi:MAG: hypothetical protein JNM25_04960 [Planctomycetes bacterium]|nr:hypothetical protein [Planctomycetota bacterium]